MGKRLVLIAVVVAALGATTVRLALAQGSGSDGQRPGEVIQVVFGPNSRTQFFDFDHDGLGFGDRLTSVGPLLNQRRSGRVGIAYLDCSIVSGVLEGGTFDCTYVLKLDRGDIVTQGIDPAGPSDVMFSVTGGNGAYRGASGEARYVDTDVTTIAISLDG